MNVRTKITMLAALLLTACQELPSYLGGDALLAQVGRKELRQHDVESVVPAGLTGSDSVEFVGVYIDRWVRKQLKLQEAEVLFSASGENIGKLVEEYRQALLIRKLEQYYVEIGVDTTFTDSEIAAYYNTHKSDFRLDRSVVKGCIVRFDDGFRQSRRLKELMGSKSEADRRDFRDLCLKNEFTVNDFSERWTDFPEFLSYLPTLRSQNYSSMLASTSVQEMRDSHAHYFFRIYEVRREGEPIPLERLRPTIRRVLLNQRKNETIRRHEEELYTRSTENGEVKIFGSEKSEAQESTND